MIVSMHPADAELVEGARHDALNAGRSVAEDFIYEFDHAISVLRQQPQLGARWRGPLRRYPLRRFPFSLVYYEAGARLRIIAIAHQRRKPGYWQGRV